MKRGLMTALMLSLAAPAAGGFAAFAGKKVSVVRHPNLAAAQKLISQAIRKLTTAQERNEFDLGGHAKKAKELLEQAYREAKEAALASNVRK